MELLPLLKRGPVVCSQGSLDMLFKTKKASRLVVLSFLSAITLTIFECFSIQITNAGRPEKSLQSKAGKVSPTLKTDWQNADKTVNVIVTLNGPKSGLLNSFMQRAGVQKRREMKRLSTFSLSLPLGLVAELASFPEISYVSANEVVHS